MKSKILILAVAALALTTSCASNCGNSQWRKRRFVEVEKPIETHQIQIADKSA